MPPSRFGHLGVRSIEPSNPLLAAIIVPIIVVLLLGIAVAVAVLLRGRSKPKPQPQVSGNEESRISDTESFFDVGALTPGKSFKNRHRPPHLVLQLGMLPSEAPPSARETPIVDITFVSNSKSIPPQEAVRFSTFSRLSSMHRAKSYSSHLHDCITAPPPAVLAPGPEKRPPGPRPLSFPAGYISGKRVAANTNNANANFDRPSSTGNLASQARDAIGTLRSFQYGGTLKRFSDSSRTFITSSKTRNGGGPLFTELQPHRL